MHIRELVKRTWQDAGLYKTRNQKLQTFLKYFDEHPELCWDDLIQEFRTHHYDLFDDLIPPLLKVNDKLLRLTLIRKADLKRSQELNLLNQFVKQASPLNDELELAAIAQRQHKTLVDELRKRSDLPREVYRVLNLG